MTTFTFIPKSVRFFTNLHLERTIKNLQHIYRKDAIVYGFMCNITHMVYVGSTLIPGRRFHNHLVTGKPSNLTLQQAITQHGLNNFIAYVFEIVVFPTGLTLDEKKAFLKIVEQKHMDKFPKAQLYNNYNSSAPKK
jgi:group I intron endonuclease